MPERTERRPLATWVHLLGACALARKAGHEVRIDDHSTYVVVGGLTICLELETDPIRYTVRAYDPDAENRSYFGCYTPSPETAIRRFVDLVNIAVLASDPPEPTQH